MPGYLLQANSPVLCAHGGQAKPTFLNLRVKVMGQPVVTQLSPYTVTACSLPPAAPPGPCILAQWTMGALRVRSMGQPLVLQNSQAVCIPTGGPLNILLTQTRVKAM
jgi:hypothetical protein